MAVYKVIQDIEAEDKLLGPLTLKQFIFAVIAVGFGFVAFMVANKTGAIYLAIPFLPFIIGFGVLAAPLSKDQPSDLWLAARIRFFSKPRKRIWDQSGIKELVTITVPKKEIKQLTDNLSQGEVKSRLNALADTLDSRGWAVKNVALNMYSNPSYAYAYDAGQERLLDPSSLPRAVDEINITNTDDILDTNYNPTAQHFEEMIEVSTANHKAEAVANMKATISSQADAQIPSVASKTIQQDTTQTVATYIAQTPNGDNFEVPIPDNANIPNQPADNDYWFMNQPSNASQTVEPDSVMFNDQTIKPASPVQTANNTDDGQTDVQKIDQEKELLEHIKADKSITAKANPHHKVVKTPEQLAIEEKARQEVEKAEKAIEDEKAQAVTAKQNPVNIELARSDDLSVETISKLANRKPKKANGEVVVNLR